MHFYLPYKRPGIVNLYFTSPRVKGEDLARQACFPVGKKVDEKRRDEPSNLHGGGNSTPGCCCRGPLGYCRQVFIPIKFFSFKFASLKKKHDKHRADQLKKFNNTVDPGGIIISFSFQHLKSTDHYFLQSSQITSLLFLFLLTLCSFVLIYMYSKTIFQYW